MPSDMEESGGSVGSSRMAAITLVAGQVLAAAAAFLVNLLAARVLDPAPRGDLAFALQLSYFFSVLAVMGLERPYMATRAGSFNSEYRSFARMVLPGTIAVIPLIFLVTAVSPFSFSWLWLGAAVLTAYVVLNSLTLAVRVAYVSSRNWKQFALNAIAAQLIIVLGAGVLTFLEVRDPILWMGIYALSGLPALFLLWMAWRTGPVINSPTLIEQKLLRRRGWILLPSTFSNMAMLRADRLLLPVLSSSAQLGLYVTVATVMEMATWPVQQWVDASLRQWAQSPGMPTKFIRHLMFRSFLLLTLLSALLGVAAWVMVETFLPDSYQAAKAVILPLAVASVIYGMTRVQEGILIAFGAEARVAVIEIVGALVAIAAYVLLIPAFGMLGAAYGSILGYLACAITAWVLITGLKRPTPEEQPSQESAPLPRTSLASDPLKERK
ncbi:hypothetical protein COCCU_06660 [Corynebacterium occultum]|uniref:Uncharacterized protein n=1 Tax=Corynebacterium occultum TaxID=2675219 RepID=A0A6B8WB86_9CORY|nr:polysaccharide biosynthesis C-terminal domain-containing protein [Corynebacterium occultum]QGU07270.1 hypothetical protein COCCU_06660 [Corynebacterium occultum]